MVVFIDNEIAEKLLKMEDIIEAVERGYNDLAQNKTSSRPRLDFYVPKKGGYEFFRWGTVEGVDVRKNIFAIRLKSDIIYWTDNGREEKYCGEKGTYCGLVLLFDTDTGLPLAVINDGYIQHMRVAASSVVGAKHLARKSSKVLSIIGSGGMARSHAEAFFKTFSIDKIKVYSPSKTNRETFAREMSSYLGCDVESKDSPEDAVKDSDILLSCTNSNTEVINPEWLQPGIHVSVIRKVEAGAAVRRKADIVATLNSDLFNYLTGQTEISGVGTVLGSIGGASMAIAVGGREAYSKFLKRDKPSSSVISGVSIFDIISGKKSGRTSDSQITLFDNTEGAQGTQFAYVCAELFQRLSGNNTDRNVPNDWFLENIKD